MRIITVINAKGGCGKSTIAMNMAAGLAIRGHSVLLIDMDPQAQVTQWLAAGDGLRPEGTLVAAITGAATLEQVVQPTGRENLWFVASSEGLEDIGRQITDREDYAVIVARLLSSLTRSYDFVVIDSPNQISPIMENAILPSDLFVVPFESTKAVRSYANFFKLVLKLRPEEDNKILHVLSNLTRLPGLRRRVIEVMERDGMTPARSEIRSCGWLAQVDEHGGSIFAFRPKSRGAIDLSHLIDEALEVLGLKAPPTPVERPIAPPVSDAEPSATLSSSHATEDVPGEGDSAAVTTHLHEAA